MPPSLGKENGVNPWLFWAKWSRSRTPQTFHPLLCHLIDVALVTETMWWRALSPRAQRRFAAALGVDERTAGCWIVFWAGLHDLGKAAPVFQRQSPMAVDLLQATGLVCPTGPEKDPPHGTISAGVLRDLLPEAFGLDVDLAGRIATIIGGHHGVFPPAAVVNELSRQKERVGKGAWQRARADLAERLAGALDLPRAADARPQRIDNAAAMALAGFISVADWIGSNEEYFPHEVREAPNIPPIDVGAYMARARAQAERALRELGWLDWPAQKATGSFADLFPRMQPPRPVQGAVEALAGELAGPALVVVEAPMGEGKTEAALYMAEHWAATLGQGGYYVALPTQATSDQMFGRVRDFLQGRYPDAAELINLQLLHGHAALSAEFEALKQAGKDRLFTPEGVWGENGGDGALANVVAAEWFTARKRGLLAPYGVGTVDQALLAVLQTRHVFVRLFGLGAKTVIIDEVHAYDTYMTTLLTRLLQWLGALGAPVVLLSATLPWLRREALVRAYAEGAGWPEPALPETDYPRLTWATATGGGARHVTPAPGAGKEVALTWVDGRLPEGPDGAFPLAERLRAALANGGCAAVICNTVGRAQQVYRALAPHFAGDADDGEPVLDLLHARFLYGDREERERRVLRRFGKGARTARAGGGDGLRRPARAVLVATQIIEQSLDLDFDLLVTDLAPADLVLQRAGRLHRHDRPGDRPPGLLDPQLWIVGPKEGADGVPAFGRGNEAVYEPHLLLRSWLELRGRDALTLPRDIERVVEAVYSERDCPPDLSAALREKWTTTWQDLLEKQRQYEGKATRFRILPPTYDDDLFEDFNRELEEDDPAINPTLQALTRLSEPTARVVLLAPNEYAALNQTAEPRLPEVKVLLRSSVTLGGKWIVPQLLREEAPRGWARSAMLRHYHLIGLDAAGRKVLIDGRDTLRLDPELGALIESKEEGV